MSRIVALFHRDGRPIDSQALHALVAPVRYEFSPAPHVWTSTSIGLAQQEFSHGQPATPRPPRIAFDGRLDNRDAIAIQLDLDSAAATGMSDAELVLACYCRFGESFASRLTGDFSIALWDHSQQALVLARDLMGVRPLYYWISGATCIAASEIKSIAAHADVDLQPDDEGLADAVLHGHPHAVRVTCFRSVIRVVPGCTVIVARERVREVRHAAFDPARQTRYRSIDEYAAALRSLFAQAVRRRIPRTGSGPIAVTVSGGLDSSAIFCQAQRLQEAGVDVAPTLGVSCVFPDDSAAGERHNLTAIETQHRVAIHRIPFQTLSLLDEPRWLRVIEFPRLRWTSETATLEVARQLGCSSVLDGFYGDQMMASDAPLFELLRRGRLGRAWREFQAVSQSMLDSPPTLLLQEYAHYFLWELAPEAALRALRASRRAIGRDGRPRWYARAFRDLAYRRSQQQRRAAGPFGSKQAEFCARHFERTHRLNMLEEFNKLAAAYGLDRAYPFMDRDLVEFMMAIPGEIVNWQGRYKGLFREAARGVLPESIRTRYWKADFTAVASDATASGYSRFRTYFEPESLSSARGYVERAIFMKLFESYRAELTGKSVQPPSEVSAVVGLELWLRTFFRSDRHDNATQT